MIVITGALGFIGSCLVRKLNEEGHINDLFVVDDFYKDYKNRNLEDGRKWIREYVHRDIFLERFQKAFGTIDFVFHLGARTDTTEKNGAIFDQLNVEYSKAIWKICTENGIPLVYASSAATYGSGELGFEDAHELVPDFKPLNPYGKSKNDFDKWALQQKKQPPYWAGLKFFNVYGPNEYHKGRMASVIFHAYNQIKSTAKLKLFRSHRDDVKDGEQKRDFIYVKDVIDVCYFLYKNRPASGLYNVGTGEARTFLDLANATFAAMSKKPNIEFIDTPEDIRETYQYYTQANMDKLRDAGYSGRFTALEDGINDYVRKFLQKNGIY